MYPSAVSVVCHVAATPDTPDALSTTIFAFFALDELVSSEGSCEFSPSDEASVVSSASPSPPNVGSDGSFSSVTILDTSFLLVVSFFLLLLIVFARSTSITTIATASIITAALSMVSKNNFITFLPIIQPPYSLCISIFDQYL